LTAGGWIDRVERAAELVANGADKIVVNTAAYRDEGLIGRLADKFGSQCVVVSIDVRGDAEAGHEVAIDRGREATGMDPVDWAREAAKRGGGEILLTSIDRDGSLKGYDLVLVERVAAAVEVPVIAFGGVGQWQDLADGIGAGAEAVSAGNIFHFTEQSTRAAKNFLREAGLPVR
jgi:cyclase